MYLAPVGALALCSICLWGQHLACVDVNTSNFPQITVRAYSFDAEGNPTVLDPIRDRIVTEYLGVVRQTAAIIDCPSQYQAEPITTVFAFDWTSNALREIAATALRQWFSAAPAGSEGGIVVFGTRPYLLADVTSDTAQLIESLSRLPVVEAALPFRALLDTLLGAIAIGTRGQYRRSVVLVTDHLFSPSLPSSLAHMLQTTGTRLFVVALHRRIPATLRKLCVESGGAVFEATTTSQVPSLLRMAAAIASGFEPCTITWQSIHDCVARRLVQLNAPSIGAHTELRYELAPNQVPVLDVLPRFRDLGTYPVGVTPAQEFVLTALNADITLLAMTSDPSVEIVEGALTAPLLVRAGQQYRLTARLRVARPERTVGTIRIVNTGCSGVDVLTLAANTALPTSSTLAFLSPAGDTTVSYAGLPLLIQWTGALPSDSLTLAVQQLGDTTWTVVAERLTSTEYRWLPPAEGRYRLQLRSQSGMLSAESGMIIVQSPPFAFVPVAVPPVRSGTVVEFRPAQLLCSNFSEPVSIDSLQLSSGRSFQFARAIADTLPPGTCTSTWIRFAPLQPGVHRDTLIAYTPVGIRRLLIEGLATEPQLTVPATIRFQAAPLGIYRDTLVQWLACATIPQQVRIEPAGPDSIQFQLLTIRTITLPVDTPCTAYPFAFRAQRLGRSCLRLLIEGQEHQPYECVLIGDVVCAQPYSGSVLAAPQSISTQAGRVITVPIWMPSVPAEFRTMQRPFRFTVRCNASALLPEPPLERGTVVGGERRFSVTGRGFIRGDTLALLRFSTYWGDAPIVQIRIEDFAWLDDCPVGPAPTTTPVVFTDYCTAGGTTRLFLAGSAARIERVDPQPSDGTIRLVLAAEHPTWVELRCLDLVGMVRWRTELGKFEGRGEFRFQLDLPAGQYLLQARSPLGVSSTVVLIAR